MRCPMKISFQKFNFIRALRRDKEGSCFIVNDIESGANLVLRTITRRQFDIDRAGLSRFYAWFQTQCHPHLGRLLHAGIAPNHEVYWTREYLETAEQADKEALLRSLISAVTFLHADGYIHRHIRPS